MKSIKTLKMVLISVFILSILSFSSIAAHFIGTPTYEISVETDQLTLNIPVRIDSDDSITPEQVKISDQPTDTCQLGPSSTICSKTYTLGGNQGKLEFSVELFDDSTNSIKGPDSKSLILDIAPPTINILSKPTSTVSTSADIEFEINDEACIDNQEDPIFCRNRCSGINKLEYRNSEDETNINEIQINTNRCRFNSEASSKSISIPVEDLVNGDQVIILVAYDNKNHVSREKAVPINVDKEHPSIDASSFTVTYQDNEISSRGPNKITPVTIQLSIPSLDLKPSSVSADLSKITGNPSDTSKRPNCPPPVDDTYVCTWSGLDYNPQSPYLVKVDLEDVLGNSPPQPLELTPPLTEDTELRLTSIVTGGLDDGKYYSKSENNQVTAVFDESSGLDKYGKNIKLSTGQPANSCEINEESSLWTCTWEGIDFDGDLTLSLSEDSKDIFGNTVNSDDVTAKAIEVVINDKDPEIQDIEIKGLTQGDELDETPSIVERGDFVNLIITVSSDIPLQENPTADFSEITGDEEDIRKGVCSEKDVNIHKCTWNPSDNNIIASIPGPIKDITILDLAGNKAILESDPSIEVFDIGGEEDLWKSSSTTCSPKNLDRTLLADLESIPPVRCDVTLVPHDPSNNINVKKVDIKDGVCQAPTINERNVIEKLEIPDSSKFNNNNPTVEFKFIKGEYLLDTVDIKCDLLVTSEHNGEITKPEIVKTNFELGLFNLPLGTLEQSYQRIINEEIRTVQKWNRGVVDNLREWLHWAEVICRGNQIYQTLREIKYALTLIFGKAAVVVPEQGTAAALEATSQVNCLGEQSLGATQGKYEEFANPFCSYITNCKWSWADDIAALYRNIDPISWIDEGVFDDELPLIDYLEVDSFASSEEFVYWMEPKRSLTMSAATLCLPGIIHNIDKQNQIRCMYISCMMDSQEGRQDPYFCERFKSYEMCKYNRNQWLALIPYKAIFDHIQPSVQALLKNPLGAAVAVVPETVCRHWCNSKKDGKLGYKLCHGWFLLRKATQIASTLKQLDETLSDNRYDYTETNDLCADIGGENIYEYEIPEEEEESPPEDCKTEGDEDNNGWKDCSDTAACPEDTFCNADETKKCVSESCVDI